MSELSLSDLVVLLRARGVPVENIQFERLHEGYLKLRGLVNDMSRPMNLDTGLVVTFWPEDSPCTRSR